jgi:hypothetical protein
VRGKASYGGNAVVKSVGDVLKLNKEAENCKEIRILHCSNLVTCDGVEESTQVVNLNLSSNRLENIDKLRFLSKLEILDLKANRIRSLKAIEHLSKLQRIDASQNLIESLDGFGSGNNQLQVVVLFQNNLKDLEELTLFKQFNKLTELCF